MESGRYWREVYVGAPVAGTVVEGFIDLLYEGPEGYVVVDYKTDALPAGDAIEAAVQRYRLQAATYAALLSQVLDRPVARAILVFLHGRGVTEREIPDLPAAMEEVGSKAGAYSVPVP